MLAPLNTVARAIEKLGLALISSDSDKQTTKYAYIRSGIIKINARQNFNPGNRNIVAL